MIERRLVGRQVTTLGTIPAPFRTAVDGPPIITEGLTMHLDAGNPYSYPSSGTTWTDLSGTGNNGTLLNGPTFSTENGGAISFDGSDDGAQGGLTGMTNSDLNRTLEVVFHFTDVNQVSTLINNRATGGVFEQIGLTITGASDADWSSGAVGKTLSLAILPSTGGTNLRRITYTLPAAGIYHAIGTSAAADKRLYVNGIERSSNTVSQTGNLADATKKVGIGCIIGSLNTPTGTYFPSRIYIVRTYSRQLSASEAFQNFQATRWRFGI